MPQNIAITRPDGKVDTYSGRCSMEVVASNGALVIRRPHTLTVYAPGQWTQADLAEENLQVDAGMN